MDSIIGYATTELIDPAPVADSPIGYATATLTDPYSPFKTSDGETYTDCRVLTWDGAAYTEIEGLA